MPPGEYRFGPSADGEWFTSNGRVGYQSGASLASSVVGMDTMVRNMTRLTSASEVEAIRMASLTPPERVGLASDLGSLEVGKRADVLVLSGALDVQRVFIGGDERRAPVGTSRRPLQRRRRIRAGRSRVGV
jgi:N-acetylglucosamine-6-phosphate deacetylase